MQEAILFHSERAVAELDRALSAENGPAARAHFDLLALHFERLRSLTEAAQPPRGAQG